MRLPSLKTLAAFALGALAAALVLGALVLFLQGDDNAPIQVVLPTPEANDKAASETPPDGEPETLQVYISGAVRNPGVYSLRPTDRLQQAVEAAGGASAEAQLEAINLAVRVQDEGHYHIPRLGEAPTPQFVPGPQSHRGPASGTGPLSAAATGAEHCGGLTDLNSASTHELEQLPGIGPVRASGIASYREAHGPFQSIDEVQNVTGIGPVTFEGIRDLISVC